MGRKKCKKEAKKEAVNTGFRDNSSLTATDSVIFPREQSNFKLFKCSRSY